VTTLASVEEMYVEYVVLGAYLFYLRSGALYFLSMFREKDEAYALSSLRLSGHISARAMPKL
jgi:hypothetical protein